MTDEGHAYNDDKDRLVADLREIAVSSRDRIASLRMIAEIIRRSGNYRWVGLYDVDHLAGVIRNVVFSGPGAPVYPDFPITKGLTGVAVAEKPTMNVADVTADGRYLTAFGSTRSEIIVPIFDGAKQQVIGTIDIESEQLDAFSYDVQALSERCADVIATLWQS